MLFYLVSMIPQIIHNPIRKDRFKLLWNELSTQQIPRAKWWLATIKDNPIEGCHLSHRQIVQWARKHKLKSVLVFEDDIMFTSPGAFNYYLANTPSEFDVYTAGVYGQGAEFEEGTQTIKRMSGTHCYIVHERFYDRMIAMDEHEHLDIRLSQSSDAVIKMCYPMAALQHPGYSDILKEEVNYNTDRWVVYPLWK